MRVTGIDERNLVRDTPGADFVVFIYTGGDASGSSSWSVDSLLLTGTDIPQVLHWLRQNLPTDSCWSLGVVPLLLPPHPAMTTTTTPATSNESGIRIRHACPHTVHRSEEMATSRY